ncbi:MAG TPA: gamma-glutamyl-gamma-aminobutyrate hydrolase family protein [Solirubrobacteraceae bacterium]|nr:gamma-glutamyl-gamma-aminobutyrate hydrolase family protein [Solirubrobacteraceae bacterium]
MTDRIDAPLIGISCGFTDYGDYLGVAFSGPIEGLGGVAVILPYTERPASLLSRLDGLMLAGGRDIGPEHFGGRRHPRATAHSRLRDDAELPLARDAIAGGIPLLGICRGMQVINVALGGSLHPDHSVLPPPADRHRGGDWDIWEEVVRARLEGDAPPEHPCHEIVIAPDSRLAGALGSGATVNSYHHQSIAAVGDGVVVAATAPDGVIEAIEVPAAQAFCVGVQWELQEERSSSLLALFVEAAAERSAARHPAASSVSDGF